MQSAGVFEHPLSGPGRAVLAEGSGSLHDPATVLASPLALVVAFLVSAWLGWIYARGNNNSAVSMLVFVLGATAFSWLRNMDHGEAGIAHGRFLTSLLVSLVPATTAYLWTRIRVRHGQRIAAGPPAAEIGDPDPIPPKSKGRKGR